MNRIWQLLLGIERSSPGVRHGGRLASRVRGLAARDRGRCPDPGRARDLGAPLAAAPLGAARLSPAKRRGLGRPAHADLARRRDHAHRARPGLDPHARPSRRILMIVLDDSESMRFSDPYTDNSRAVDIATRLKLESAGGKSPVDRLRETPRLDWSSRSWARTSRLWRGAGSFSFTTWSRPPSPAAGQARTRKLDDIKPNRADSPLGDALARRAGGASGPAGRRRDPGDRRASNTGEDPLQPAAAAARQNIPIFSLAAGGDEGPRTFAWPRSRSARSFSFATR